MSTFAIILACIVFMIVVASVRGNPGRAIADTTLLVIFVGIVAALDFIFSRFIDTGYAASLVAILLAAGFALDALRAVGAGINRIMRAPDKGVLLITHYQRLLDYVTPDKVHVLNRGEIVRSGGPELALALEREGYEEAAA